MLERFVALEVDVERCERRLIMRRLHPDGDTQRDRATGVEPFEEASVETSPSPMVGSQRDGEAEVKKW